MNRKKLAAAAPVAVVAVIAGILSYGHIESLALSVGQPLLDARLLPGAVDFLIVAGSVLLWVGYLLGWVCVGAGVIATLFANVESGSSHGPLGMLVASWPAVAVTVASLVLERWLRTQAAEAFTPVSGKVHAPKPAEKTIPEAPKRVPVPVTPSPLPVPPVNKLSLFADDIKSRQVPGIRAIRERANVGQPKAQEIQAQLREAVKRQPIDSGQLHVVAGA